MANCPLMRGLTAYWVFIKIHKIVKMWTQLWQLATIKPLLLLNFHFLVHLRLFKFLFSASFTFKTLEMKLVLVPFKLFLVVKKFPTPRNVTFTFLAVLKSLLLFKTVLHVGHFMSSSTPVSRSSLCLCTFSFQFILLSLGRVLHILDATFDTWPIYIPLIPGQYRVQLLFYFWLENMDWNSLIFP